MPHIPGHSPFELSAHQQVIKTFERSAAYATSEEATFALMTAPLSNMRTSAAAFIQHEDAVEAANNPPTTGQKSSNITDNASRSLDLKNLDKADDEDEGFFEEIKGNFTDPVEEGTPRRGDIDANLFGGIFNSECIPCGARLNAIGELNVKAGLSNYGQQWLELWKQSFATFMSQIRDLLNIFNNLDKFVDLCALLKFLKDFVCIPDLQRILSVLMALMSKISFELGGVFDLILGLIGPILTPFLSGLVDMLTKYLLLIVKPIECIIDALQNIVRKLDYNVLFDNIDSLQKRGKPAVNRQDPRGPINVPKIPFISAGGTMERRDIVEGEGTLDKINNAGVAGFNKATGPIVSAVTERKLREQAAVDKAAGELRALNKAAENVDLADAEASEKYKTKRRAAIKKYEKAVQERDVKNIAEDLGGVRSKLDAASNAVTSVKGGLLELMSQLREAMEAVESFVSDLTDELGKVFGQYVGGQSGMIVQITKKFAVVQMLGLIASIISAIKRGDLGCEDEEEDVRIESYLSLQQALQIWTDDEGDIHIEQDPDEIDRAIRAAVADIGAEASQTGGSTSGSDTPAGKKILQDKGEDVDTPGQKLKKLVEFTGDPVLDTDIARITEALTTPVKVRFKCPLQTSVADAEQVNQWIQSLNT